MNGAAMADRAIELARAKINLTLHVGAARADGYHPLSSIVIFADAADILTAMPADEFSLTVSGPFFEGLSSGDDNLVLRAARHAHRQLGGPMLAFHLEKKLPLSSGIGGGSADGAAAIRHVARFAEKPVSDIKDVVKLGADIPVCLRSRTALMRGIGELIEPMTGRGRVFGVLVNCGIAVPTGAIFDAFDAGPAGDLGQDEHKNIIQTAMSGRNDLQPAACKLTPEISHVLAELSTQEGVRHSRMSGSGATCYAITDGLSAARTIAVRLRAKYPPWWIWYGGFGDPT
ncbi:4-(cytidine 5'-diphospho)-2-C-methyl-D-erythritol kinase [Robiginitomaculum antarcticum]|uniref:4-(cytidine 5'-diphospho)-2-C-methyl-D-erythritol kinase n=1 Tax=Robiginitomaculum antarcticum TaxID=437507 RepID=UPI0003A87BA2|nr:4-(cytidine 5'-diphospho)-2-C-methyl-D-erythritol kinase [Robiginitomaculum antarcticum]